MASWDFGKKEICEHLTIMFPEGSTCLDVGACRVNHLRFLIWFFFIFVLYYMYRINKRRKYYGRVYYGNK